jgi:hypothetical protein
MSDSNAAGGWDRRGRFLSAVAAAAARTFLVVLEVEDGEPHFRELEPPSRMAQATRSASTGGMREDIRSPSTPVSGFLIASMFSQVSNSPSRNANERRRRLGLLGTCMTFVGPFDQSRTIMETLGHSQISLTLNTYSHVLPALQADTAAKLDGDPEAVVVN